MNEDVEKLYMKYHSISPLTSSSTQSTLAFNKLSGFLMGYVKDHPAIPLEQRLTILDKIVELKEMHQ